MPARNAAEFNSVLALLKFAPSAPEDLDICDLASAMLERAEQITADFSDIAASQQVVKECDTLLHELGCNSDTSSALDLILGIREAALDCISGSMENNKKCPISRTVL
jgi:hypothetical protein